MPFAWFLSDALGWVWAGASLSPCFQVREERRANAYADVIRSLEARCMVRGQPLMLCEVHRKLF